MLVYGVKMPIKPLLVWGSSYNINIGMIYITRA